MSRPLPILFCTALALIVGTPALAQEEAPAEESQPAPAQRAAPTRPATRPTPKPSARPAQPVAQAPSPATAGVSQPVAPASGLPNGASAVNEIYGDWTVDCRMADGQKLCVLTQSQGNSQTNQRVFAIELRIPKDGKTEGTILMPFGLRLENGAILKLDDKDLGKGLRFSTCVPAGCLLPVSFPAIATDAMQKGKTLTAAALNLSSGAPVTFNISLNGFSTALNRIGQLGN